MIVDLRDPREYLAGAVNIPLDEVEKRIGELKSVETWLNMNLNMVKFSIQGLELQRAALQAMRAASEPPRKD